MKRFDLSLLPERPNLEFEQALWEQGVLCVAGMDEAGRGPLAGPVAAAAVVLPPEPAVAAVLLGVNDSKCLAPEARQHWAGIIRQVAAAWAVGFASVEEIDTQGILPATRLAACRAAQGLGSTPQHILLDYLFLPDVDIPQTALIKGDARSLSIAAASILAKTARDECLCELDRQYPGYGFAANKGYGTRTHLEALGRLGPCEIHRRSFEPVRSWKSFAAATFPPAEEEIPNA